MKRLVSTLNLTKEDWLRYRKCGITGTDAGAILGLNPYRSAFQVYHDKISDIGYNFFAVFFIIVPFRIIEICIKNLVKRCICTENTGHLAVRQPT